MSLRYQFELIKAIRNFFDQRGFLDVITPPFVENPGMETHIHSFEIFHGKTQESANLFAHTSPEFMMKELLSNSEEEFNKIFTITYVFRDEPSSPIHRNQFLMLEWYRKNEDYFKIMDDTEDLLQETNFYFKNKNIKTKLSENFKLQRATVQEIFLEYLNIDILNFLDKNELKSLIQKDFKDVPLPTVDLEWDDYYFLLFLNKIEHHFEKIPGLLLYEFPNHLSALSTLKESDPRVCQRFEVYLNGIELCNAFDEVTDLNVLKKRFKYQNEQKKIQYGYTLPTPKRFYSVMETYPKSAGIALGVERLLLSLIETDTPFFP